MSVWPFCGSHCVYKGAVGVRTALMWGHETEVIGGCDAQVTTIVRFWLIWRFGVPRAGAGKSASSPVDHPPPLLLNDSLTKSLCTRARIGLAFLAFGPRILTGARDARIPLLGPGGKQPGHPWCIPWYQSSLILSPLTHYFAGQSEHHSSFRGFSCVQWSERALPTYLGLPPPSPAPPPPKNAKKQLPCISANDLLSFKNFPCIF